MSMTAGPTEPSMTGNSQLRPVRLSMSVTEFFAPGLASHTVRILQLFALPHSRAGAPEQLPGYSYSKGQPPFYCTAEKGEMACGGMGEAASLMRAKASSGPKTSRTSKMGGET